MPALATAPRRIPFNRSIALAVSTLALTLAGCATTMAPVSDAVPVKAMRSHLVWAVTADMQLVQFRSTAPEQWLEVKPLSGLAAGERLLGIDFRVHKGVLYALADSGRVYTVDTDSGAASAVPGSLPVVGPKGSVFGFDFNPAADKLRVVSLEGQNLRLNPDNNATVDFDAKMEGVQADGALRFTDGDRMSGKAPRLLAAAYTYNKDNEKLTTNFALDASGALLMQGTREGVQPAVSPNLGVLYTVGMLGTGELADATLDIADTDNQALAAARTPVDPTTRLWRVDLDTGRATDLGRVGNGGGVLGMAIEP